VASSLKPLKKEHLMPVNILIVDDQPGKVLTYEAILKDLGENLITANSAAQAFDQLLRHEFAVVLVDVCMPELDGFQLAKMIRDHPRFEKIPIIFISAIYLSELDLLRGYESGAVDYMPVPVAPEILRAKVRVFAELNRKSRQLDRKTRQLERLNDELERRVSKRTGELLASTEKLRASEERLRMASEAAGFGTYEVSLNTQRILCSEQMKHLLGYQFEGDLDLSRFLEFVHSEDRPAVRRCLLALRRDPDGRHRLEFRVILPDGSVRWLFDRGRVFFEDEKAQASRVIGTILDITDRKQAEERQSILMAELDHRVKNILANVSAIAKLSSKRTESVEAFVKALDARIQAVSRAHGLLRRDSWTGIGIDAYIREILAPFIGGREKDFVLEGEPLYLLPKAAQSLALVLHELATNAAKYGSLSVQNGSVRIAWSRGRETPGMVRLTWQETGGPKIESHSGQGFGSTVIKAAAGELGADLSYDFRSEGVAFSLEGRIEQLTKPGPPVDTAPMPFVVRPQAHYSIAPSRILLVEDEPLVALQVKNDLEMAGHQVTALAASVDEALNSIDNTDFDIAFLDIRLGDSLSTEVAGKLLERGIPFIFGSGFDDDSILPPRLRKIPRLTKPYETGQVSQLLSDLVREAREMDMNGKRAAS
jgi:PAS domain S-box-containing protein